MAIDLLAWWTRDVRVSSWVFMSFTLLNVFLLCTGYGIHLASFGPTPPGQISIKDIWFWVFAFPFMAASQQKTGVPDWAPIVLLVLNPWLYGLMGWCAWRMVKLLRRKPDADPDLEEEG